jgi:hypothetical protein
MPRQGNYRNYPGLSLSTQILATDGIALLPDDGFSP